MNSPCGAGSLPPAASSSAGRVKSCSRCGQPHRIIKNDPPAPHLCFCRERGFADHVLSGSGQDVADISESQAAVTCSQLLENGDYYWSVTLISLIVGTVGGGTALATQRECLGMLGCHCQGKADKFAEICAGVALAGETSLASAVLSRDWVSSHERLGRLHT
jgi:Hydroxymethylglutaryl-coenzyme A reductase